MYVFFVELVRWDIAVGVWPNVDFFKGFLGLNESLLWDDYSRTTTIVWELYSAVLWRILDEGNICRVIVRFFFRVTDRVQIPQSGTVTAHQG